MRLGQLTRSFTCAEGEVHRQVTNLGYGCANARPTPMRPLVVFTGQGIARADGFNLTRRLKALPQLAGIGVALARGDRQNLDTLIASQASRGDAARNDLLRAIRALCLKERRSTLRKTAHRDVFAALAASAAERVVVHLTACIDGLTTTFAVRDCGATWLPFRRIATLSTVASEAVGVLARGTGFLHFPAHGEAPLVAAKADDLELQLQCYFGDPNDLRGPAPWTPSIELGLAHGLAEIEASFPPARLAYGIFEAVLAGERIALTDAAAPAEASDLLVIGYGADAAREGHPFERRIVSLHDRGYPRAPARWTALVYRPGDNRRVAAWYEKQGFVVAGYGEGDIGEAVRCALAPARPNARPLAEAPTEPPTTSRTAGATSG